MERLRILFLAANPGSMGQVNAGREAREIREKLRVAAHRDAIELIERFAVRPGDLQQTFFEVRPHVVHFSGHGTTEEELVLEGEDGAAEPLGKRALTELFRVHEDVIRVVVLSACHSRPQVEAISEHIECAIGMRRAVGSRAATEFSAAFYLAVGFGASAQKAFDSGIAELRARGIPEDRTPQLVVRPGVDARRVILLGGAAAEALELPKPPEGRGAGEGRLADALPGRDPITAATGEHRVCTVMFVDLVDARRIVSHLDPEDAKDIVDRAFAVAREQVEAMGGVFEDLPGSDRAMAVFGAPRASDDDAERAVLAALRVQAAIARVALPRALRRSRLSARIGVSTGRVFAEPQSATRPRFAVLGEAVDTASSLLETTPEGAVVIGRDTYRPVVGLFNLEPLCPVGSLPVHRVLGAIPLRPVLAISDFYGVDTSLVGRAAELLRLTDALETMLEERRAGLVTLIGASGIGRSRLLAELYASLILHREELLVMVAQGSPLLGSTSYGLAAAMLRRRFAILDNDEAGAVRQKLRRGLRWLRMRSARRSPGSTAGLDRADLDDALDQIAGILGAGTRDQAQPGSMALGDGDGPQKQRIAAAAARLLRLASGAAPIVILCDKLQWADGASLDLLDDLLLRAEDLPVLAVCAARPELLERRPSWGRDKAAHTRVDLAPLARRHVEEMIRDHLRRVPDLAPSVVRTLADRAEGHPLILVETLHLLVDAGVIEVHGDKPWSLREEKLGALALPATVQGIVQARLDRLEAAPRTVLAQAAVVGRTFWAGALEQMQRADRSGVPAALPAGVLTHLRDRQLIRPRAPAMFPGEHEYVFSESAMYEVAYETLSVKVRRPLHLVVARWLEARAAGGAGTALVALHYDRGGDPGRAAAAYVRAAGHAVSLGENAEARSLLERARDIDDEALENASVGGTPDERQGVLSWQDAARVRLDLGDLLRRLGQLDDAERTLEEARARLPRRGDASDANDALRFDARVDHRLALARKVRGATKEVIPLVERAIARAKEAGAAEETPAMYALLAFLHRREGRPEASWRAAREGLRVCRALERRGERWKENVAELLFGVGAALFARGRIVGAERSYRQATRLISEAANPRLAGIAWNGVGAMRFSVGDLRGARAIFLRALRLKERAGDLHQIAVACSNLAEVELPLNELPAALDHARRAVRMCEQARAGSDLAAMYRNLAEVLLAAGQIEEALTAGCKALAIAEVSGRVYLNDVALTLARACARAGQDAAHRARAAEAAGALRASLSAHLTEGDLRGKAEECRAILASVFPEDYSSDGP